MYYKVAVLQRSIPQKVERLTLEMIPVPHNTRVGVDNSVVAPCNPPAIASLMSNAVEPSSEKAFLFFFLIADI